MKSGFLFIFFCCNALCALASNVTPILSFDIRNDVKPPILSIVNESVKLIDSNGNNAIDADEHCSVQFKVSNSGVGDAVNCKGVVVATGDALGISAKSVPLPIIPVGETVTVNIPIVSNKSTVDGNVNFELYVEEPLGFGTDKIELTAKVNAFMAPLLQVVDYTVTGDKGGYLMRNQLFDLQLLLQNTQHGIAEDVTIKVEVPNGVFVMDEPLGKFHQMKGGEKKSLIYKMAINNQYKDEVIPINVLISEKYNLYARSQTINLQLNQQLTANKIVVDSKEDELEEIQIASLTSDVDKNIPRTNFVNDKTFVVIIANENYQSVAKVPFAINDGEIFGQYCAQTLGIPKNHIRLVKDATLNNIKYEVRWLSGIIKAYKGEAKIIFYYAGHGIPDEANRSSYLLPIDGNGGDVSTGYRLDDLYQQIGELPSKSVTIFIDACFSGTKREGDMMASARGVAIKAKQGQPVGNMVVFSASQADETAYPYHEKQHGLFTYFLLKKLQETQGDVFLSDLSQYIITQVSQKSIVENGKSQTPVSIPSPSVGVAWKQWQLK